MLKCDVQGNDCGLKLHNRGIMKRTECKRQVWELHREKSEKRRITRRNCSRVPTLPRDCGPNTYQLISVLGRINLSRRLEARQRVEEEVEVIFSHFLRRPLQLCQSCLFSLPLSRRLRWWRGSVVQVAVSLAIPSRPLCDSRSSITAVGWRCFLNEASLLPKLWPFLGR